MIPTHITMLQNLKTIGLSNNKELHESLQRDIVSETKSTQSLLCKIAEQFEPASLARSSCLCLIWMRKKFKNELGRFGMIPLDIIQEIARLIYSTKNEEIWKT